MKQRTKVLIVEDDKYILKAMDYAFTNARFVVKATPSAEEGLKILESWHPDAIVLDILLPGIDGYAFLRIVRQHKDWKKIPVIIASNLSEDPEMDIGASEYIVKGELDLDKLVQKVERLAAKR